jgi:LuxR family transcriptional regulator, maltose regulon positive regulatory protein
MLERYPTIAVLGAWLRILNGRPDDGARWARAAQRTTVVPDLPDGSATLEPWIAALRAWMCPDGIERMLADSELALDQLGPEGWWRPTAHVANGVAHALLGRTEQAGAALSVACEVSASAGAVEEEIQALSELALLAIGEGAWEEAERHAARAVELVDEAQLDHYVAGAMAYAVKAHVAIHQGDLTQARERIAQVHRLRPLLNHELPWFSVQISLELARIHLALGEAGAAGAVLSEASGCSSRAPSSRPRRYRSTASSASHPEQRRSSAPSRSACWKTRSIRLGPGP